MSLTSQEIIAVMERAKELGLKQIKVDGFEASFAELKAKGPVMVVPDLKAEEILAPPSPFEGLTEEEILYYATPYFDELQAQKQMKKKRLSEEVRE